MEQHYSYNARGNIIGVENIGNTSVLTGNIAYNYDALGRLLSCTDGQMTEAYEYDTLGNRIAKQVNGNRNQHRGNSIFYCYLYFFYSLLNKFLKSSKTL